MGNLIHSMRSGGKAVWTRLRSLRVAPGARKIGPLLATCCVIILFSSVILASSGARPSAQKPLAASVHAQAPASATSTPTAIPPTATPVQYQPPTVVPTKNATPPPPPPKVNTPPPGPSSDGGVPNIGGKLILVNLSQQWLWAYQDRTLLYDTPVTTGMPGLETPTGVFSVRWKETNVTFISPWPQGSPYYYSPEHIDYALYFLDYGYYIHDASWRHQFGPGTNYPHTDADGTQETGSHGCVNVPYAAGAWLYSWAGAGVTIDIYGTSPAAPPPPPAPAPTATPVPPTPTATSVPPTPTPTQTPPPTPTPTLTPSPSPTPDPNSTPTP